MSGRSPGPSSVSSPLSSAGGERGAVDPRRIGLAMVSQETGTFNPTLTTYADFVALGVQHGADVIRDLADVATVAGHLAGVAGRDDVETVPLYAAQSVPGGRLSAATVERLANELLAAIRGAGRLDALALHLHGACAGEGIDDVDGHLLGLVRAELGDDIPIVLGLDHHANITAAMVAGADLIVGHRTQPHDLVDTARVAARQLLRMLDEGIAPTTAWRKIPMITHQEQYLSDRPPMSRWFERARFLEGGAVLQISVFPMQPWLDVAEAGWSVVVHTDGDTELAERIADELADLAWSLRHEFMVQTAVPVAEAVARAEAAEHGLTVLSDTGDSVLGGAGGDSTTILAEMIRQDITGPALVSLVHPGIAELVADHAVGDRVRLEVGGAVAGMHPPVVLEGVLRHRGPIEIAIEGFWSPTVDFGAGAVLETSFGTVVISELRGFGGVHPVLYEHFGIDPAAHRMAVVKTASNFQFFAPITREVIRVDTPGPTQSDIAGLAWTRIPRPVFPLDPEIDQ